MFLGIYTNFKSNPYNESFLFNYHINWFDKIDSLTEIEAVGQILYTYYVLQFLIAGIILLLAVIGAVVLALNISSQSNKNKKQLVFKQVARTYKNSLFVHKK
jgi:NADH-quinone oxidoreductase subunit J